jgi:hypothetical protein
VERDDLFEVKLMAENRVGESAAGPAGGLGLRTRSKIGLMSSAITPWAAPASAMRSTEPIRCAE